VRGGTEDADVCRLAFSVPFSYPVYFTRDVFHPRRTLLASAFGPVENGRRHRAAVYVDDGVVRAWPGLAGRIAAYFRAHATVLDLLAPPEPVPGGEQAKSGWRGVQHVMTRLGQLGLCRHSYVVAVGGGGMLDMVGFAASLVHRGVRLIRLPTTVLAQNDAGVGVKNGMDEHGRKNFVGTFAPPHAVVDDFDFLATLDDTHWRAGIAEAVKVALIRDAAFFRFLESRASRLRRRDAAAMETLVRRCAILHLDHIRDGGDPFERGTARPLDFGHWAAHKLEAMTNFALGHGQAVAVGIALDTVYAAARGLLSAAERDRVIVTLARAGLPLWHEGLAVRGPRGRLAVLDGLDEFREHLGGRLTITLPKGIGGRVEVHAMDAAAIVQAIGWLQRKNRAQETLRDETPRDTSARV
jgi:3-dehydroquinate synthase